MKRISIVAAYAWMAAATLLAGEQRAVRPARSPVAPASFSSRGASHCGCPTCAAVPTCAVPTCAAPTCAAPTCAAPTCAAPTCAAPTCAAVPSCDAGYGSGCGCAPVTSLLPSLVDGLDGVVRKLYYNPCNLPCPRPQSAPTNCLDVWFGYHSGCGCHGESSVSWPAEPSVPVPGLKPGPKSIPAPQPSNPFVDDDDLQAPPAVPKDLGAKRGGTRVQQVKSRVASSPEYSREPAVVAPVKVAELVEPILAADEAPVVKRRPLKQPVRGPALVPTASAVKAVGHESAGAPAVPKNPLRD